MTLRKKTLKRVLVCLVLLLVAAMVTVLIKEALSLRQPENALPSLTIYYGDNILPSEYVERASYEWRFLTVVRSGGWEDPNHWREMPAAWVLPGTVFRLDFSFPSNHQYVVSRAYGDTSDFVAVSEPLTAPSEPGAVYTYRVESWWNSRGSVQFYFRIRIAEVE